MSTDHDTQTTVASVRAHRTWILVLWPVVCAALTVAYVEVRVRHINDEITTRPPIAVLSVDEEVLKAIDKDPSAQMPDAVRHVEDVGAKLASAGFIVLDKKYVYSFPQDLEAKP